MKERYTADAALNLEADPDKQKYKTFYGDNLDAVVKEAEKASVTDEAYLVTREVYRPRYGDWDIAEWINIY